MTSDVTNTTADVLPCLIKKEHVNLKEDFIGRVRHLLTEKCKVKEYTVRDSYGTETEQVELIVNNYEIAIKVSKSVKAPF